MFRGSTASALLRKFGIDPKRYWLLMDLFRELSERREMFGQLGRNSIQLKGAAYLYFAMMSLFALLALLPGPTATTYFWIFQSLSVLLLFMVLMPETGNSLVNPDEALTLAHFPIDGATYNAAKLSHLLRIVLFLVPGINGAAAIAGAFLEGGGWLFPLKHLGAAMMAGVAVALLCCALFGWLLRLVPASRLKAFGALAEALPFVFIALPKGEELPAWLTIPPEYRIAAGAAVAVVAIVGVVFGIRALSADYLVRAAAIAGGGQARGGRAGGGLLDGWAAAIFGGQAARAGFAYTKLMMRRDWQFRRQMLVAIPSVFILGGLVFRFGNKSPFGEEFSPIHFMPHMYALVCLMLAFALPFGAHHKAGWIFQTFPPGVFDRFARGIHGYLWFAAVLAPHGLLLPLFAYLWGMPDAALFLFYSATMASLYLGLTLRLVEGIPFTKPAEPVRNDLMMPLMFVGGIVIAAIVALQHFVLFQSAALVIAAACVAAAGGYWATRHSLRTLAVSIRYRLGLLSTEAKQFYTEIDA